MHGPARRDDRQRRRPDHSPRPRHVDDRAAMDRRRLPARPGRRPADRRQARRPVRTPPAVPDRGERLHDRVRALWARAEHRDPDRRPARPGARGRDDDPRMGLLERCSPTTSCESVRHVRPGDGLRRDGRPDPGRRPRFAATASRRVATRVPDQRSARDHGADRGSPAAAAHERGAMPSNSTSAAPCSPPSPHSRLCTLGPGTPAWMAGLDLRLVRRQRGPARVSSARTCCAASGRTGIH